MRLGTCWWNAYQLHMSGTFSFNGTTLTEQPGWLKNKKLAAWSIPELNLERFCTTIFGRIPSLLEAGQPLNYCRLCSSHELIAQPCIWILKAIFTTGLLSLQHKLPGFSALFINLINYTFTNHNYKIINFVSS